MNKPMYCPLSFANETLNYRERVYMTSRTETCSHPLECSPDCAWAFKDRSCYEYCCGIALMSFKLAEGAKRELELNWRDY